jgi:hypothetical protein
VSGRFAAVADAVRVDWPKVQAGDRAPTWSGWAAVEAISTMGSAKARRHEEDSISMSSFDSSNVCHMPALAFFVEIC